MMTTTEKGFLIFGYLMAGCISIVLLCAFAEWVGNWKKRIANYRHGTRLEEEIAAKERLIKSRETEYANSCLEYEGKINDLKAQIEVLKGAQPYR